MGGDESKLDLITFSRLKEQDLPLMHRWLNTLHVVQWYEKKETKFDEVEKKYMPRITGQEPTKPFLIEINGIPIGYIQEYYVDDDPEIKPYIKGKCVGLDLFIGEESYLGKGLGSRILKEFMDQVVFQEEGIEGCIVDPSPANKRMIRVNEKAGFKYLVTTTGSDPKYLMYVGRDRLYN